jgi:hypothetical protein
MCCEQKQTCLFNDTAASCQCVTDMLVQVSLHNVFQLVRLISNTAWLNYVNDVIDDRIFKVTVMQQAYMPSNAFW